MSSRALSALCATRWLPALLFLCGASVAGAQEPISERCGVMVRDGAELRTETVDGFSVLAGPIPFRLPDGYDRAEAVICSRSIMQFGPNDYRVITDLSTPLYLVNDERVVVLEISNGQFRARMARGALTGDENARLQQALNEFQSAVQAEARP